MLMELNVPAIMCLRCEFRKTWVKQVISEISAVNIGFENRLQAFAGLR